MKTCQADKCILPVFGKGYCSRHQWKRTDRNPIIKQKKPIRPISKKLAKQKQIYRKLRIEFLSKIGNRFCAVYPHLLATEIHHMDGRENCRLNNVDRWLAVSREGHQWIENHPALAKERGFSGSRIKLIKQLNQQ